MTLFCLICGLECRNFLSPTGVLVGLVVMPEWHNKTHISILKFKEPVFDIFLWNMYQEYFVASRCFGPFQSCIGKRCSCFWRSISHNAFVRRLRVASRYTENHCANSDLSVCSGVWKGHTFKLMYDWVACTVWQLKNSCKYNWHE